MMDLKAKFKNQTLLTHALTHRSYCNEHPGFGSSNERLEFLGDSVLSILISRRLYDLLPDSPEGDLTNRRSWLVQTGSLSTKAKMLGLDTQLLLSKGEEDSGGRSNSGLLANTFEAVLGALFLDSGLEASNDFLLEVFPDDELLTKNQIKDPKSLLQELVQSQGHSTPIYQILSSTGPDHARQFVSAVVVDNKQIATGEGTSKQRAEAAAAATALNILQPENVAKS